MAEYTSIKEILEAFGTYTGLTQGCSMWPMLHQGRDNIIVVKPEGRLKKYDIPVYQYPNQDKYIMHRIVEVYDDHYLVIGDNMLLKENVTDDMICGKLVGYYKNGKRYIDCENGKLYKLYSRIWTANYPVRRWIMRFHTLGSIIKRKVFRIKDEG